MTKALRALIVEDSEDDAAALQRLLRRGGYDPTHARVETAETMRADQLRLYLSAAAYVLVDALRRLALKGTAMAEAQVDTIRLRLLRIGARISFSARRVVVSMSSGYPWQALFGQAWAALRC